ncbi:hypothetical protein L0F63_002117, partial [Massospora cicadina]
LAHIPVDSNDSKPCDWSSLGLTLSLCENLKRMNITTPNSVQIQVRRGGRASIFTGQAREPSFNICIPICLGESSVVLTAETGSGKTLVYATAMVQKILASEMAKPLKHCNPVGIVLIPSKELAWQVALEIKRLSADTNIDVLFGKKALHLIATPSSLFRSKLAEMREMLDLLKWAKMVVIDEMDLLLSGSFTNTTQQLLARLSTTAQRQFVFCGATLAPSTSVHASRTYLEKKFPNLVYVDTETVHCTVPTLKETFVDVPATLDEEEAKQWKVSHMFDLLRGYSEFETPKAVPELPRVLSGLAKEFFCALPNREILCVEFHKEVPRQTREEILRSLRLGWTDSPVPPKLVILFTTDLLSRGLDLPNLDLGWENSPSRPPRLTFKAVNYVSPKDRRLADRIYAVAAQKCKSKDAPVEAIKFENLFSHRRSLSRRIKDT